MKTLIGLMAFLSAGACLCAEVYKWVDEKGVVNYGEKPPARRPAQPVDTNPRTVIETDGRFGQMSGAERGRAGAAPQVIAAPASALTAFSPRGMEFDIYIRLQPGMTEGELLTRAGRPDHESLDSLVYDIVKTYYYFPTTANPYTTVVTLRGGRIAELDRIKKF
ncbi:MAG TPA: DUF4124 domain-containing protein [Burkholderiales bacterium]|nr:DUF4124 domain-containing protein [Burkholderiales bacterium]